MGKLNYVAFSSIHRASCGTKTVNLYNYLEFFPCKNLCFAVKHRTLSCIVEMRTITSEIELHETILLSKSRNYLDQFIVLRIIELISSPMKNNR